MKYVNSVLILFLLTGTTVVHAEAGDLKFAFELGVHSGGDKLATVKYTDGSTQDITAGGGLSLAVGLTYDLADDLMLQTTVGFKEDSTHATNGEIAFRRNTLDILVDKKINDLIWVGGGLTYHSGVEYSETAFGYSSAYAFDNALGFIGDVKFDIGEPGSQYLSARFTFIDYTYKTTTFSGNSVGFIWGGAF